MKRVADCGHDALQDGLWPCGHGLEVCYECFQVESEISWWEMAEALGALLDPETTVPPEAMLAGGHGISTDELLTVIDDVLCEHRKEPQRG